MPHSSVMSGSRRGQSAFPQARLLGGRVRYAVVGACIAPYRRSEQAMAAELLPAKLSKDMLVLADRNFGFKLWQTACASGASLVWRVKANLKLEVQQMLPDGFAYLSHVFDSADKTRSTLLWWCG